MENYKYDKLFNKTHFYWVFIELKLNKTQYLRFVKQILNQLIFVFC